MRRQPATSLTIAVAGLLLLAACGGDDKPEVLPEVKAFNDARDAMLAGDAGGYDWLVKVKAFPKPLVKQTVCWKSPDQPPLLEALSKAEAYGAHRGDAALVDVDVPASLALALLGVEDEVLAKARLEPDDLAPAVVGVDDGRITTVTVNGSAVAKRLESDEVPVNADIRSHAELATADIVLDGTGC